MVQRVELRSIPCAMLGLAVASAGCGRIGYEPGPTASVPDARPACAVGQFWEADFGVDPTTLDVNRDGIRDWAIRGGRAFPADQLAGGLWRAAEDLALDTQPRNRFNDRTIVRLRFESLGVPSGEAGAVFWVNVDANGEGRGTFSAVYASLEREAAGGQRLVVYGRSSPATPVPLSVFAGLPAGMIELPLDLAVRADRVKAQVEGRTAEATYPETARPNRDDWATLIAWAGSGGAAFDSVSIVDCRP